VLGSALYPLRLLDLGDLLVAGLVVPMLAPYIDVLATIAGTPLDLLHFVVGGRPSFLAFYATPNHGIGYHRTLTSVRSALLCGSTGARDRAVSSSTGAGDGALFSSSTTLLGGGVPVVPSPLVGRSPQPCLGPGPHRPSSSEGQQQGVPWAALG